MAYDAPARAVYGRAQGQPPKTLEQSDAMAKAGTFAAGANGGFELRGQLNANEIELQEGYFAVAQDTVLMVRPGSPLHQWLKQHQGRPSG